MRKERKVEEVQSLQQRLEKAKVMIFAENRGLKVSEVTDLRMKLSKDSSTLKVVKNRLMKRVLKEAGLADLEKYFTGPTAIASSEVDPIMPAKAVMDFVKTHEKFAVKGGYLDGRQLSASDIENLAKMPSREVLLARVLGSMNAPATNLVGVLSALPRKLLYALNAIKETKQA